MYRHFANAPKLRQLAPRRKMLEIDRVKYFSLVLVGLVAALLSVASISAKPGWLTNYKQAQDEAKANKKLLLLDFTGSDWCGWCIKLDKEIFSKSEFKEYASKNLVLLEIDFPRGKELTGTQKAHNFELAERYDIQGFPTIIVLDGDGKKLGELGYTPGGPAAFIAELDRFRKS